MSVDPTGLAALLESSGPVKVDSWPTPIDAGNVVNVTLRDAYAAFDDNSRERADFLGNVAKAAVDQATSGTLGKPAQIAKVLGKAAHEGHLTLAFARPDEQKLSEDLGTAQEMRPVRSDAIAVTSSNAGGNKIDYFLRRTVDYQVKLTPNTQLTEARWRRAVGEARQHCTDRGVPAVRHRPVRSTFRRRREPLVRVHVLAAHGRGVEGRRYPDEHRAGARAWPQRVLAVRRHALEDDEEFRPATRRRGQAPPGLVRAGGPSPADPEPRHGARVRRRAPGMEDRPRAGMKIPVKRRATVTVAGLDKTTTFRVHLEPDPDTWDLWDRLVAGA